MNKNRIMRIIITVVLILIGLFCIMLGSYGLFDTLDSSYIDGMSVILAIVFIVSGGFNLVFAPRILGYKIALQKTES